MTYLFSDIDNTLVYSHRNSFSGERIVVEYLNDRIQSYMTKRTYEFFSESNGVFLIPTTTRTCEQYARLSETFDGFGCKYSLVCNGGILLENNQINQQWLEETKAMAKNELSALDSAAQIISDKFSNEEIHVIKEIMVYFKTESPAAAAKWLSNEIDGSKLNLFCDNHKVYCIPASITKGNAVKRFVSKMGISWFAVAGDSAADISMLELANFAFLPSSISNNVSNPNKILCDKTELFSDFICDHLDNFQNYIV